MSTAMSDKEALMTEGKKSLIAVGITLILALLVAWLYSCSQ